MPTARNGQILPMDNQPIQATFFGEGRWLTSFVTPSTLEVKNLYQGLTRGIANPKNRIVALHQYVGNQIKYKPFVSATLNVEGKVSHNKDVWLDPSMTIKVGVGNCANKAFLLASLLRSEYSANEVYAVLGNLIDAKGKGGHAWVQLAYQDRVYVIESTRGDVPTFIPIGEVGRYESVHYFNDIQAYHIKDRVIMEPYSASYSPWLKEYLDWAYIKGNK